jgi:anti-sigma-K factor RskA
MNVQTPSRRDALAAEYVLGTLHGAARRRFEQLLPAHPTLRQAVVDWEGRLNRLAADSPPVPPPPQVWTALETRLFPAPRHEPWWNRLGFWRGVAVAGVFATVLALTPQLMTPPSDPDAAIATIRGSQREVLWTVARTEDNRLHVSNLRAIDVPPDQHCLLWFKTRDTPPVMLGVLPDDGGASTLFLPASMTPPAQGELWVTMQPVAAPPSLPNQPLHKTRWQAL